MPVARYFVFVGGVLVALLLAINLFVPQDSVVASHSAPGIDKSTVRIHSDQKLPERVVFDTTLPPVAAPAPAVQTAAVLPAPAPEPTAKARVRDSFAQFVPGEARKAEAAPTPKKRRVARAHTYPRPYAGPRMRFAQQQYQQPHFGFFGGPVWNW